MATKRTPTGFGSMIQQAAQDKPTPAVQAAIPPTHQQEPSGKQYKALTYRVTPEMWRRLQELRIELDMPVTDIITQGINMILAQRGLKPLK